MIATAIFCSVCVGLYAPGAPGGPGDVIKHRLFLTGALPMFSSGYICFHMPFRYIVLGSVPIFMVGWSVFHYTIGYYPPSCILYVLCVSGGVMYTHFLALDQRWHTFKVTRELEKERRLLVGTQVALHGMLSTLFDASCTCRIDGVLITCTPQWH